MPLRVLILGGTTEASALAHKLAGDARLAPVLSLAGRTASPRPQPIPTRVGGFGGIAGLVDFLRRERIEAVVDATHPYADQMSAHAVAACAQAGVPLASLVRPEWTVHADDRWQVVGDAEAAARALGTAPRRVFLGLGRQDLHVFATAPQHHYLARLIEQPEQERLPPDLRLLQARGPFDRDAEAAARALGTEPRRVFLGLGRQDLHVFAIAPQHHYLARLIEQPEQQKLPPDLRLLQARGPFERDAEERLLREEQIDVVVSRNSGGAATYAKIEAARALGLPVVMIARPYTPAGEVMTDIDACVAWLHGLAPRGV
jgi:precorrin-6A/cobalt-precorrin-6A reductase